MCLLKAFWKVILPVPVTLKRFFALLLVLTFGIFYNSLFVTPCRRSEQPETYGAMWEIRKAELFGRQRYDIFGFLKRY
jgi:hypothetical protein